jgi:allantoin racemase
MPAAMRLALVNPNTSTATTELMLAIARDAAPPDVEIGGFTAPYGVPLITDSATLSLAAEAVASTADSLRPYDGVIVAAFGDPGRSALVERLDCPVIGIAEASMAEAQVRSRGRFSVVTTTPGLKADICALAANYGYGEDLISVRITPGDPALLMADPAVLEQALAAAIEDAVREDRTRATIIGGGPLAKAARRLAPLFRIPVIEPIPVAVTTLCRQLRS